MRAPDPKNPGVNLLAKRVRDVPLSKLEKLPPAPAKPTTQGGALATARKIVAANDAMLKGLGVKKVVYGPTTAGSGVEFGEDGTLHIAPTKVAASMETVRANQAKDGIPGTPEDWFSQVLAHEGIHAADAAVARAKGQTLQQRYEALPAEAMPGGWQKAGREVYGAKGVGCVARNGSSVRSSYVRWSRVNGRDD